MSKEIQKKSPELQAAEMAPPPTEGMEGEPPTAPEEGEVEEAFINPDPAAGAGDLNDAFRK